MDKYLLSKVSLEYISSESTIRLYFFAIVAISFKFLQIVPEGLFGEFKNNNKFLFLIALILSSICFAVGNQFVLLSVCTQ